MEPQTATDEKRKRLTDAEFADLQRKGVRVIDIDAERQAPSIDRPTGERMAKGGVIVAPEERMGRPKPWHTFESVHDGLLAAGDISQKAWEGGNKFIERYHLANGSGARAGGTAEPVSKSTGDMSNRQALAKNEIARWSRDLAPQLFDCLESVIALGKAPSSWARDSNIHPAGGKAILCAALEQFALTH